MKHNNDFRHDLEFGQMSETKFHKMLSEKKVEVKSDITGTKQKYFQVIESSLNISGLEIIGLVKGVVSNMTHQQVLYIVHTFGVEEIGV